MASVITSAATAITPAIGLLGGTFDPVHNGHLQAAKAVSEQLGIADMRLMPNYLPPHREQPVLPPEQRIEALRRAIEGTGLGLELSEWQAAASGEVEAGYSVESLMRMRQRYPHSPLVFVLGDDAYAHIEQWKMFARLPELCHLVVVSRPGYEVASNGVAAEWLKKNLSNPPTAIHDSVAGSVQRLQIAALDVSATQIRACLNAGQLPTGLVPDTILSLLEQHDAA